MSTTKSQGLRRTVVGSPLGAIRITADDQAVYEIAWIEDASATEPAPSPLLERARAQIDDYFHGRRRDFNLPLAPQGTDFQRRVWALLTSIGYGKTLTYGEAARRLGTSARALGQACGRNPIPIVIPCHRIIAAESKIGGFSAPGGIDTKRFLIQLERCSLD